jgi:hypothetical protein
MDDKETSKSERHNVEECWRLTVHERELREQWQDAHHRFHIVDKEALVLARREIDRRLDEMNQFREQIAHERGEFMRRDMYDEQHNALRSEMDARLKLLETNRSNMEGRMWAMGAGISVIAVGLNLLLHYLGK